ncbi:MAG: HU family DNA-binding protein [Prevotella sp.]|nr:HU family DNA-binding protein [Prevotella sp.]
MAKGIMMEFARVLAEKHGLQERQARQFLKNFIAVINDGLRDDKLVKVKGLGTFKVIEVKDRASVNVKTGERIVIEGRGKITFSPDSVMKELVNKPFSQFDTVVLNDGVEFEDSQELLANEALLPSDDSLELAESDSGDELDEITVQQSLPDEEDFSDVEEAQQRESAIDEQEDEIDEPETAIAEQETAIAEQDTAVAEQFDETIEQDNSIAEQNGEPMEQCDDEPADQCDVMPVDVVSDHQEEPDDEENPVQQVEQRLDAALGNEGMAEDADKEKTNNLINTETENEETTMEEKTSVWGRLLSYLLVALIALGIGYYIGIKKNKVYIPMGQSEMINGEFIDSTSTDSLQRLDSINAAREARIKARVDSLTKVREARNESINAKKNAIAAQSVPAAPVTETKPASVQDKPVANAKKEPVARPEEKAVPLPQGDNSQGLKTARQMVNTGAYVIVGTQETITVRADQNMKKISKFYLGDGMECYIQAYNGVVEVKEGMKLRIPKLQLKKKK